ncbi:unnamed protein product [Cuscuta epithymum]|uniref:ATP-dependent DNA helicase n=1 Tax=Cuscuta epithymum TaxID=186058 RepID=A0AAV0DJL2_9ASTE|nr:unnamed protein product [Cuscuta epithymum]
MRKITKTTKITGKRTIQEISNEENCVASVSKQRNNYVGESSHRENAKKIDFMDGGNLSKESLARERGGVLVRKTKQSLGTLPVSSTPLANITNVNIPTSFQRRDASIGSKVSCYTYLQHSWNVMSFNNNISAYGNSTRGTCGSSLETGQTSNLDPSPLSNLDSIDLNQDQIDSIDIDVGDDDTTYVTKSIPSGYLDVGDPSYKCSFCGALFWYDERLESHYRAKNPKYSGCCMQGKVKLPLIKRPPPIIENLFMGCDELSKHFLKNVRSYNNMFSFTSMGGKIDSSVNGGKSPPIFKLHGQNFHLMGSLLPADSAVPKFAQLYIYDTENEVCNRINSVRKKDEPHDLHERIVEDLKKTLDEHNVLVKSFRMAGKKIREEGCVDFKLKLIGKRAKDARTYNLPSVSEVAALIVGDLDLSLGERDIVVETCAGGLQRINELHPSYFALQYPLLFPYGEDGYREDIPLSKKKIDHSRGRQNVSIREFIAYRLHERGSEISTLLHAKRLFQQFVVDAYTLIESSRLRYIRNNQKQLRCEMYKGLTDALLRGDTNPATQGKRIILPSSFTGGARYMIQNYQDAMAICRWIGYPDLFITFTCNSNWPEIARYIKQRNLKPEDRPDVICRIFKMKLDALITDFKRNKIFGTVKAVIYTIEFQKRGLPHAHILLFLDKNEKFPTPDHIDSIISAEIPCEETDPEYFNAVKDYMMHGPCGPMRSNSPCMVDGQCSKHFPKRFVDHTTLDDDGYPVYRRRNQGRTISKNGEDLDNRYVVPHNRYLLLKYAAHINVEWCNQSRSIKYLFKYVNKGNDRVTATFYQSASGENEESNVDEVKMYYDCRYISSCEAAWRTLGYEIQYRSIGVERLSFHLPNEQVVYFDDLEPIDEVLQKPTIKESMFLAWFKANEIYPEARDLTYAEMPMRFVWKQATREWTPRKKSFAIGRLFYVPPSCGELFYLRCLLNVVRGPTSFEDIMKVGGVQYNTFRDACYALGLLNDDKEYIDAIKEASFWASAHRLRKLFVALLIADCLSRPEEVWEKCWTFLSEDIVYKQRLMLNHPDLTLTEDEVKNFTLFEIQKLLRSCGRSLDEYNTMPVPDNRFLSNNGNRLVYDELRYDRKKLAEEHANLLGNLTNEQRVVYDTIIKAIDADSGGVFFVYGYGGTGKTFVWNTLSAAIRSKGEIVLNVASSGIASLLLPGGRTAHSRFKIPINPNEDSTCNVKQGSALAELLIKCKLIIWDEAPMVHKYCFEALDRTLRDILRFSNPSSLQMPFGGKIVVFGGDFRQILPVIPKGRRQDIVSASINSSYLWQHTNVMHLTKNLRLLHLPGSDQSEYLIKFSEWIASIGDGTIGGPNDGFAEIEIPEEFLITNFEDPIAKMVETIYPDFGTIDHDPSYLEKRAILAPTLDVVDSINDYMLTLNGTELKTYLSSDSPCQSDANLDFLADIHTPEFLNGIKASGVPNHQLHLKVGTPVMLMRNIDHSQGLCNGTRMVITRLGNHILEAKVLTGISAGQKVLIPRMSLTPSDVRLPFKFQRRQFPIIVSYAMTINKSQGQSLSKVGLFLRKPVFSHGQLYVALSRVTDPRGLKILICDKEGRSTNITTNVVFHEIFQNL